MGRFMQANFSIWLKDNGIDFRADWWSYFKYYLFQIVGQIKIKNKFCIWSVKIKKADWEIFNQADSRTKCNKDEPGNGRLKMRWHHGCYNHQVEVAWCTSISAAKDDTKFTASWKPNSPSARSPVHWPGAAAPSAANSAANSAEGETEAEVEVEVEVSVGILPNKPAPRRLSEHNEAVMPAV